ncbi:MAG TPA: helix-turn-helix domain-containing protein [Thermoplasmata archaeon]|nr:helix-turn-helix domain-containing protein [Thermoplasmata archaeon]
MSARGSRVSAARASSGPWETPQKGCPVGDLFQMLGKPHMLGVLHAFEGQNGAPLRFRDLEQSLHLSPKTLSQRLRTLVEAGFLTRRAYGEIPPRVEYERTPKAVELSGLFRLLADWASRNTLTAVPTVSVVGKVAR